MKKIFRNLLRWFCKIPIRGRHRLVETLGKLIAPSQLDILSINGIDIRLDHTLEFHRCIYYGIYEENNINFMKKKIGRGDVVFDAGANIGYLTAIMRGIVGKEGKVFSFEPSEICYSLLRDAISKSEIENVEICDFAISDKIGKAIFCDTPRVLSRGYACLADVGKPDDAIPRQIQTMTLDAFCKDKHVEHINLLKLDIEGSELKALKGGHQLLSEKRADYILIETTITKDTIELNSEIIKIFKNCGYYSTIPHRNGKLHKITFDENTRDFRADIVWVRNDLNGVL